VSLGNHISAEGAKALGDALKDNTTLTSLSLGLGGEKSLVQIGVSGFLFVEVCITLH
jgi:hypothetical protein